MNAHKKLLSITLFLSLSSPTVYADQLFYAPDTAPFNIKFKDWSVQWWQFALSIPKSENPLIDTTGAKCVVGQRGPVWFLVGTLGDSPVHRVCNVPAGKALFFPVLNSFYADDITQHNSISYAREQAAATPNDATILSVTVDGHPIQHLEDKFRIRSNVFELTLPEENVLGALPTAACPPSGTCSPAVDDGYYVMLKPLSVGNHTVHIIGATTTLNVDVTYTLSVVPVDLLGK